MDRTVSPTHDFYEEDDDDFWDYVNKYARQDFPVEFREIDLAAWEAQIQQEEADGDENS